MADQKNPMTLHANAINGMVIVTFSQSTRWVGWLPEDARTFAEGLVKLADHIEEQARRT